MNHQFVSFSTRFGGIPIDIMVPVAAIVGIYAHENGQGMVFEPEEDLKLIRHLPKVQLWYHHQKQRKKLQILKLSLRCASLNKTLMRGL